MPSMSPSDGKNFAIDIVSQNRLSTIKKSLILKLKIGSRVL